MAVSSVHVPHLALVILTFGQHIDFVKCRTNAADPDHKRNAGAEVSPGLIAGIVAIVVLLVVLLLICCIFKRCKGKKEKNQKTARKYIKTERPMSGVSTISGSSIEERPVSQSFFANDLIIEDEEGEAEANEPEGDKAPRSYTKPKKLVSA